MPEYRKIHTREASELDIEPGYWPLELWFEGRRLNRYQMVRDPEGDVMYVVYRALGVELRVFND